MRPASADQRAVAPGMNGTFAPAIGTRNALMLRYGRLAVRVVSPHPAPLIWLAEFMTPAFETAGGVAPAGRTVTLSLGTGLFLDLERASEQAEAIEIDCFTLDGAFARWPSWVHPDFGRVVRDGWAGAYYLAPARGEEVKVVAAGDGPRLRLALMRVVREIATGHARRRGLIPLHGAAVEVGGRVMAFAGPRGSGKTTLLAHALLSGGARFIANDRLFVALDHGRPDARAMPTIVSLRRGMIARFPALEARLRASRFDRHLTIAEAARTAPADPRRELDEPTRLTPAQFRALAGVGAMGGGPLAAIVLPVLAPGVRRFELRTLSVAEAAPRLCASLVLPGIPERSAAAFDGPEPPLVRDAAAVDAMGVALAEGVPCLEARLGPDAYAGGTGGRPDLPAGHVWDAVRERWP